MRLTWGCWLLVMLPLYRLALGWQAPHSWKGLQKISENTRDGEQSIFGNCRTFLRFFQPLPALAKLYGLGVAAFFNS